MRKLRGHLLRLAIVAALGLTALAAPRLARLRPPPADERVERVIVVTNPADAGPRSLRSAVLAADHATGAARILVRVPRIVLATPLPPLVNPNGTALEGGGVEIDASAVTEAVAIDVKSEGSSLANLRVVGAPRVALLVRSPHVSLRKVELSHSGIGLMVAEDASDLVVSECAFVANATGIDVAAGVLRARLERNRFERSSVAAVWQVAPEPRVALPADGLTLRSNTFTGDQISLVLINVSGLLEENTFLRANDTAVLLIGAGSVMRRNRVQSGASSGIAGSDLRGAVIEDNEVDHNRAVGIVIKDSINTTVRTNNIYTNGFGVAMVFGSDLGPNIVSRNLISSQTQDGVYVVGGSPQLRENRLLGNDGVGLRVLDFVPFRGARRASRPLLVGNVIHANRVDEPVRGEYRVRSEVRATEDAP